MTHQRGTSNRNARGNAEMRAWRKRMQLERDGDGLTAKCDHFATYVTFHTMVVDCWPVPRIDGGTYDLKRTRQPEESNNRVQCAPCSHRQGGVIGTERRRQRRAAILDSCG